MTTTPEHIAPLVPPPNWECDPVPDPDDPLFGPILWIHRGTGDVIQWAYDAAIARVRAVSTEPAVSTTGSFAELPSEPNYGDWFTKPTIIEATAEVEPKIESDDLVTTLAAVEAIEVDEAVTPEETYEDYVQAEDRRQHRKRVVRNVAAVAVAGAVLAGGYWFYRYSGSLAEHGNDAVFGPIPSWAHGPKAKFQRQLDIGGTLANIVGPTADRFKAMLGLTVSTIGATFGSLLAGGYLLDRRRRRREGTEVYLDRPTVISSEIGTIWRALGGEREIHTRTAGDQSLVDELMSYKVRRKPYWWESRHKKQAYQMGLTKWVGECGDSGFYDAESAAAEPY